jgi:cytochrome c-type biogenesis protein CcmH/NrfF
MKRLGEILLLCCAVALLMGADSENVRYERIGGKIMCACGCAQMLLKCNHVGCQDSDQMIRQLHASVHQYTNDDDVLNYFRKTWGVTAVVEPGTHGFELLAWVLPVAASSLGLLLVLVTIRHWRLRSPQPAPSDVQLDPHLEALRARARKETEI